MSYEKERRKKKRCSGSALEQRAIYKGIHDLRKYSRVFSLSLSLENKKFFGSASGECRLLTRAERYNAVGRRDTWKGGGGDGGRIS